MKDANLSPSFPNQATPACGDFSHFGSEPQYPGTAVTPGSMRSGSFFG
jgi:hypothetical protein